MQIFRHLNFNSFLRELFLGFSMDCIGLKAAWIMDAWQNKNCLPFYAGK
jgi:hypothetical protein